LIGRNHVGCVHLPSAKHVQRLDLLKGRQSSRPAFAAEAKQLVATEGDVGRDGQTVDTDIPREHAPANGMSMLGVARKTTPLRPKSEAFARRTASSSFS
jgi:hypothetical protein